MASSNSSKMVQTGEQTVKSEGMWLSAKKQGNGAEESDKAYYKETGRDSRSPAVRKAVLLQDRTSWRMARAMRCRVAKAEQQKRKQRSTQIEKRMVSSDQTQDGKEGKD